MKLLPELPLLRRELTELANRKRTYVIRLVGAICILLYVFLIYEHAMSNRLGAQLQPGINPMLGVGGTIFAQVTPSLFILIQVLMPALCCAAIAYEKESNTIGTLLLTKLSPANIVIEKFLSRIIPMLTLLLLSFPVLAHVFSLGGVDTTLLLGTIWLLLCECFLLGSLALLCSAWFPTTVGAFTGSYVATAFALILIFPLELQTWIPSGVWYSSFANIRGFGMEDSTLIGQILEGFDFSATTIFTVRIFEQTIPSIIITACFLLTTRFLLVRRAFTSQSSATLKMFRFVDRFFQWLNQRTTGGIELVKDGNNYPTTDPIAWRERSKKSLGKARYLFRILTMLQFPTLFVCAVSAINSAYQQFEGLYVLLAILWGLAALIICMKAATLMVSERAQQTLESLLACPLSAREIFEQKIAGTKRLIIVMAVPVLTVHLTLFLVQVQFTSFGMNFLYSLCYPVLAIFNTFLLLACITWLSASLGLMFHSQLKAVLAAATVVALCVFGPFLPNAFSFLFWNDTFVYLRYLSPIFTVISNEAALQQMTQSSTAWTVGRLEMNPLQFSVCATLLNTLLFLGLRMFILRCLPSLLKRRENDAAPFSRDVATQMEGTSL